MRLIAEVKDRNGNRLPKFDPEAQRLVDAMPDDLMPAFEAWQRNFLTGASSTEGSRWWNAAADMTDAVQKLTGDPNATVSLRKRRGRRPLAEGERVERDDAAIAERYRASKRSLGYVERKYFVKEEVSQQVKDLAAVTGAKEAGDIIGVLVGMEHLRRFGPMRIYADSDEQALEFVRQYPCEVARQVVQIGDQTYEIRPHHDRAPIRRPAPGERSIGLVEPIKAGDVNGRDE